MPKIPSDRAKLTVEQRNYRDWPSVQSEFLSDGDRRVFENRKKAVERYLDNDDEETIRSETGLPRQEYHRLVSRCLSVHTDGRIWGYRALIPGKRVKSYRRKKDSTSQGGRRGGLAGAFRQFLMKHPDIEELIYNLFFAKANKGELPEARILAKDIHTEVLKAAKAKGVTDDEYPFCTKSQGLHSLEHYLKYLYENNYRKAVAAREGKEAARRMGAGKMEMSPPAMRPYEQVELDAHRFDAIFEITTQSGRYGPKLIEVARPWLLALIDRFCRAILAYLLVWAPEVNQYDVLRLLKRFITPWERPQLTIPGMSYLDGAGLPSSEVPACRWALFDEIYCDNAMAFSAKQVKRVLTKETGAVAVFGRYRSPNDRPYIERFFETLEARSMHRMPNTTGKGPGESRPENPKAAALKYHLDEEFLNQALAMALANYNATKHVGLGYRTPLEVLRNATASQPLRMVLDPSEVMKFNLAKTVTIHGNPKKGRRPYVNCIYVSYSSAALKAMPSLVGQKLDLIIDYDHLESIPAYLSDGAFFDNLIPKDRQWQLPHSIEARRSHFRNDGPPDTRDPMHELISHLPERAGGRPKGETKDSLPKATFQGLLVKKRSDKGTLEY